MNKFVIYTTITGGYEDVLQPIITDSRFDYVLFSNDYQDDFKGIWQVRPIHTIMDTFDDKRLSRYPKSHPEELLNEYEASMYIDANIQIADKWVYDHFVELVDSKVEYAGIKLVCTGRDDIYRHSYDMCVIHAEHDMNAIRQMHALFKKKFPEHYGLNENNVIFRTHTDRMKLVDEEWWWWIRKYSYRDQFSFMYCLWKYSIPNTLFLPNGEDSGNSLHFIRKDHNSIPTVASKKWVKERFFEKLRNTIRHLPGRYELYCEQWVKMSRVPCPRLALFLWGILMGLVNIPLYIKCNTKKGCC